MSLQKYDASSISVLKGLEGVRKRPSMYIGDTDKKGLHHLFQEVFDNSQDEALAGFCDFIQVTLHEDQQTITVIDNGRGIPTEIHPDYQKENKTALEVVMTILHSGGKFNEKVYVGGTGGLHGVGVSCVNALSEELQVTVWRNGGIYEQQFSKGFPITKCDKTGKTNKTGTSITFKPDVEIFNKNIKFDEDLILRKIREGAFLNAGVKILFQNLKTNRKEEFQYDGGIKDCVSYLTRNKNGHYPEDPFFYQSHFNNIQIQFSFQYTEEDDETILSFANNINTNDGGTHVSGFKTALTKTVNQLARIQNLIKSNEDNLTGDDIREGINVVISVRLPQPQFEGQTKNKLGSVEAEGAVNGVVSNVLTEYFEKNPLILKKITERAIVSQKARIAAKKQSELIKKKSIFRKSNRLPGKLKDCDIDNNTKSELFICEGDSASGAMKDGREASFQAVLPIRGKIINVEKNKLEQLLKNNEIQSLIMSIGTGIILEKDKEDSFNINSCRYSKIIIATDSDPDGSHITTLLLLFLYKFMRPLITSGKVFLALPPIYKVEVNNNKKYFWSEEEFKKYTSGLKSKYKVVRFKGLGEMNSDELSETTMNKSTRKLIQVDINDFEKADEMLTTLMGKNVSARKNYIIEKLMIDKPKLI